MGEFLVGLLIFAFALAALVAPILGIVSYVRSRRLVAFAARLEALEREVRELRGRADRSSSSPTLPEAQPTLPEAQPTLPAAQPTSTHARPAFVDLPRPPTPTIPPSRPTESVPAVAPATPERELPLERPAASSAAPTIPPRPAFPAPSVEPRPPTPIEPPSPAPSTGEASAGGDWERWIGVRGAAVVGGIALALAAILSFKHAVTQGWLSPPVRVIGGALLGMAAIALARPLRKRGFDFATSALEGGGVVALYAAAWAARQRYGLIGGELAFAAMAAITVLGCWLAVRSRSTIVAALALGGGFATPLLLSTGEDRPISLFGYLLLLNVGLVAVARRMRSTWIAAVALVATCAYQAAWIATRMGPERVGLGIGILLVFAAFFAFGSRAGSGPRAVPIAALLFPFAFGLHFAMRPSLEVGLWPLTAMLGLLGAAAAWIARREGPPWLAHASCAATIAVIAGWLARTTTGERDWSVALAVASLLVVQHAFLEVDRLVRARRREDSTPPSDERAAPRDAPTSARGGVAPLRDGHAASVCALGLGCVVAAIPMHRPDFALSPMLAAVAFAVVLLVRQGVVTRPGWPALAAAVLSGLTVGIVAHERVGPRVADAPSPVAWLAASVAVGAAWLALAASLGRARERGPLAWSPVAYGLLALLACVPAWWIGDASRPLVLACELGLAACVLGSAALVRSGIAYALGVLVLAIAQAVILIATTEDVLLRDEAALIGWMTASGVIASSFALVAMRRFADAPMAWRAAAAAAFLAAPFLQDFAWFERERWREALPPIAFAALATFIAITLARRWPAELRAGPTARSVQRTASVWTWGASALLASSALVEISPHDQAPVGAAWFAVLLACATARFAHRGAAALVGFASLLALALLFGRAIDGSSAGDGARFGRLAYVHAIASGAMLVAAWRLHVGPGRGDRVHRGVVIACSAFGLIAIFLWLNLAIDGYFDRREQVEPAAGRLPVRDLTTSLAWTIYALALLSAGVARRIQGLRWASLLLLVATIAKVFLYDLSELEGLYRVGSLLGLAATLLVVSLAYQRFVFRRGGTRTGATPPA